MITTFDCLKDVSCCCCCGCGCRCCCCCDGTIRESYGKIYDGDVKDQEKLKEEYFEEYKTIIFQSIEAEAEPLTGRDLEEAMREAKETAAGLDQWTPADLRMLSPKAYDAMAEMLNEIEKGKAWPRPMHTARAAFLPKEEVNSQDPLEYRVLLMLPYIYRMWAKVRLGHLTPWVRRQRRRLCRSGCRHLQVFRPDTKAIALRSSGKGWDACWHSKSLQELPRNNEGAAKHHCRRSRK